MIFERMGVLMKIKNVMDDEDDEDLELDIAQRGRQAEGAEAQETADEPEASEEQKKKDSKTLLIMIAALLGFFLIIILILVFSRSEPRVLTIDELHEANLAGELKPEEGYVYNGYSFVNLGGVWYSRVQKGNTMYDITFNNGPKDVEDIPVEGALSTAFDKGGDVFITFDPSARSTKYITVANAGLSMALAKGFHYNLTATCTDPERSICKRNGAVTCADPDKAVIYFKEAAETKILLEGNCVTVQGVGPEIVRAKDRLLMRWYGMMG
jgi:hypothetical protein